MGPGSWAAETASCDGSTLRKLRGGFRGGRSAEMIELRRKMALLTWRAMWLERLENLPLLLEPWLRHQRRDAYWQHNARLRPRRALRGGGTQGVRSRLLLRQWGQHADPLSDIETPCNRWIVRSAARHAADRC
jgi:hypothetical protein